MRKAAIFAQEGALVPSVRATSDFQLEGLSHINAIKIRSQKYFSSCSSFLKPPPLFILSFPFLSQTPPCYSSWSPTRSSPLSLLPLLPPSLPTWPQVNLLQVPFGPSVSLALSNGVCPFFLVCSHTGRL